MILTSIVFILALAAAFILTPGKTASAEILKGTRLRVVPAEGSAAGSFKVLCGPDAQFQAGRLSDIAAGAADPRGIEFVPLGGPAPYNLYIVANLNYVITSVTILQGFVAYYSNGEFVLESATINVTNPDVVVLTGNELSFTDGMNGPYVEAGGSKNRNIPQKYDGPAYFGEKVGTGRQTWVFAISVTTELANSGAITLEETKSGSLDARYTLNYGEGQFEGTALGVMTNFNNAIAAGKIAVGTHVEITYDTKLVGSVLVRKGTGGFDDPTAPDWFTGNGTVSFVLDKEDRTLRFIYFALAGSVTLAVGENPFNFTTNIEIAHGTDVFKGTIEEVNQKIAEMIFNRTLSDGDVLDFTIDNTSDVTSVKTSELKIDAGRREGPPGAFGDNILTGRGFSLKLSSSKGFLLQVNFRTIPGRLFIQETTPNKGIFKIQVTTGTTRTFFTQDIAQVAAANVKVRMATNGKPSGDITNQLQNLSFTYTETTDDVFFFVIYKNASSEIVISPTIPLSPDDPDNPGGDKPERRFRKIRRRS